MAIPTDGGSPQPICAAGRACWSAWSPDGRFLYVTMRLASATGRGTTVVLPVMPQTGLPDLPADGVRSVEDAAAIPGSVVVDAADVVPGLDPEAYAYIKSASHRNLFRIRLP